MGATDSDFIVSNNNGRSNSILQGKIMNIDVTAIVVFLSFALIVRSVVDAWSRSRILKSPFAKDALGSLVALEEKRQRHNTLFWGVMCAALAVALWIVDSMNWRNPTPAVVAVVLGFAALGNLIYYILVRTFK